MLKISVFTSTRADYGLLYWLIKSIDESEDLELQLIVTGTHLSSEYGYTVAEILRDGFVPAETIDTLIGSDTPAAICKSSAMMAMQLSDFFTRAAPDYFVVLGDRFEILAACQAAVVAKIPIVHLHGGEVTEGAIDDNIRHAVSKLATLHFTSAEPYRRRVIQMGENPSNVFICGAMGLEAIHRYQLINRVELGELINVDLTAPYFLVVYHPETYSASQDVGELLQALSDFPTYRKIILYPNADAMSRNIITEIEAYGRKGDNDVVVIKSMSHINFLSLMAGAELLVGNSSSGLIEAPSFCIPTVNIGRRQAGRIRPASVIDVDASYGGIKSGLEKGLSREFRESIAGGQSPYGGAAASSIVLNALRAAGKNQQVNDGFFDLDFEL